MNKASGGDGIPAELFQVLKDDAVKVLYSICQQIRKTQQWPHDWKNQFLFQSQRKIMPKNAQTTTQLHSSQFSSVEFSHSVVSNSFMALISHASKVMLKILQARLQQYVNRELPDVQAGFRKGRGTRDQIANIHWIIEKAREF